MKLGHYIKRTQASSEYKDFMKEHKSSYLCAAFFILDYEKNSSSHQIDYYIPGKNKVATFMLDGGVDMKVSNTLFKKKPTELTNKAKIDVDALRRLIEDEMKNHVVTEPIKKIIAILQNLDGRIMWNITCLLDGLGLLKIHIDDSTGDIMRFEKASLFDFVRKAK